jgi:hypothetical protein
MTIDHFNVSGRACVIVTRRVSKPSNQPALDKRSSKFAFRQIPERRPSMQPSGKSVAGMSDGIHTEPFGQHGWIAKYSEYPSEIALGEST